MADAGSPATPRGIDETHPAAATAAVALAQLHHNRLASDWDTDMVCTIGYKLFSSRLLYEIKFSKSGVERENRHGTR